MACMFFKFHFTCHQACQTCNVSYCCCQHFIILHSVPAKTEKFDWESFIRVKTEPCVHSQAGLIWTIKLSSEHISYIVCCAGVECRPVYCLSSLRLLRESAENISHVVCFDRNSAIWTIRLLTHYQFPMHWPPTRCTSPFYIRDLFLLCDADNTNGNTRTSRDFISIWTLRKQKHSRGRDED